jgi:hypothetical protein
VSEPQAPRDADALAQEAAATVAAYVRSTLAAAEAEAADVRRASETPARHLTGIRTDTVASALAGAERLQRHLEAFHAALTRLSAPGEPRHEERPRDADGAEPLQSGTFEDLKRRVDDANRRADEIADAGRARSRGIREQAMSGARDALELTAGFRAVLVESESRLAEEERALRVALDEFHDAPGPATGAPRRAAGQAGGAQEDAAASMMPAEAARQSVAGRSQLELAELYEIASKRAAEEGEGDYWKILAGAIVAEAAPGEGLDGDAGTENLSRKQSRQLARLRAAASKPD